VILRGPRISEPGHTAAAWRPSSRRRPQALAQATDDAPAMSARAALVPVLAVVAIACAGPGEPEPGAVRLAALTADAAADVLSDLAAVEDPDAAGVRDAFHAANVTALGNARLAHESAPRATQAAYALSLEASGSADTFARALSAAIEARDELSAQESAAEAAVLTAEIVRHRWEALRLAALEEDVRREREKNLDRNRQERVTAERLRLQQPRILAGERFFAKERDRRIETSNELAGERLLAEERDRRIETSNKMVELFNMHMETYKNDVWLWALTEGGLQAVVRRRNENLTALQTLGRKLDAIAGQSARGNLTIEAVDL